MSDALAEMHQFYETLAGMLTPYLRIATQSQTRVKQQHK